MEIKRWLYKTIKGLDNKMLFQNILCTFLWHKSDKTVLAYEIKSHDTLYKVKIYEVSKCSRCNKIYNIFLTKAYDFNRGMKSEHEYIF